MPTYEYRCRTCKHEFEEFQSITDQPLTECPQCGGFVERLISGGGGLLFHGSGFYITDYRSDSYKQAAKRESASASSSGSDTSSKSSSETSSSSKKDGA
jgi:putative FmdB family regulatory protein